MKFPLTFLLFIFYCLDDVIAKGLQEEFTWTRISYSLPRSKRAVKGSVYQSSSITFPGDTNSEQINLLSDKRPENANSNNQQNSVQTNEFGDVDYVYRKYG